MFSRDDVVFTYTRAEAVMDGVQIELSEKYPEACSSLKAPVFCTARVWELITSAVNNPEAGNDYEAVITDICYVASTEAKRKAIANNPRTEFSVIITGANLEPDSWWNGRPLYRLHALRGPFDIDDDSPTITIAFPGED